MKLNINRPKTSVAIAVIITLMIQSCGSSFNPKWTKEAAPEYFKARFETTQGNFEIESKREWSPEGVDRLYQLIKREFYTDIGIYRVVPNFVAQFGISDDSLANVLWAGVKIADEEVKKENTKGTISYARGGKETRSIQIFVNLRNNSPYLDELEYGGVRGFPVIAEVTSGMDVVEKFYKGYGEAPGRKQDSLRMFGNSFLKKSYPKLDYIIKAYLIKD